MKLDASLHEKCWNPHITYFACLTSEKSKDGTDKLQERSSLVEKAPAKHPRPVVVLH